MKLQSLRCVIEAARQGNHISRAAEALHTSQPGVSKHIQVVESELGFRIFTRKRNRIVGLTEAGREVLARAQRILLDVDSLSALGHEYEGRRTGALRVATTHTQACYVLPNVVERFVRRYPDVRLELRQGEPVHIYGLVEAGEVDLAIGPQTTRPFPGLVMLRCFELPRVVVARAGHPILRARNLTLEEIARYPIITHDPAYGGRSGVIDPFQKAGLRPQVFFGAVNVDVSKTYVALGLGIAILTAVSLSRNRDRRLRSRDASHLFPPSATHIALRPNAYLRGYTLDLIRMLAPELTAEVVKAAVSRPAAKIGAPRPDLPAASGPVGELRVTSDE
jgi:LysR family transcriptional regulator, cys regulon transcriptional activator